MSEKQLPFFSIIIPTYNRANQLRLAINSIFVQQFNDFELIIVDDGSTDDTKKIIDDLCLSHSNIRYFYKENEERSIARNYGIEKAEGRYISFLDSDDLLYSNHLEVAFLLLVRSHYPEVGHLGFETIDENGKRLSVTNQLDQTFKAKLIHENFLHGNAIFIRRDIALKVNFIPNKFAILSEDWYVWLRLAARYPFYFDNTVTSAVVHHNKRSLLNIDADKLAICTKLIIEHLRMDRAFMNSYQKEAPYHFANHCTLAALYLAMTGDRNRRSLSFLIQAIRFDLAVIFRKRFIATVFKIIKGIFLR